MSMNYYSVRESGLVVLKSELDLPKLLNINGRMSKQELDDMCDCAYEELMGGDIEGVQPKQSFVGADGEVNGSFDFLLPSVREYYGIFDEVSAYTDEWVIFTLPTYPSLFEAAYRDEDDLINQMKERYGKYIKAKDFDYEKRLVEYDGVYYG